MTKSFIFVPDLSTFFILYPNIFEIFLCIMNILSFSLYLVPVGKTAKEDVTSYAYNLPSAFLIISSLLSAS